MIDFIHSSALPLILPNPFLVIVSLTDAAEKLTLRTFSYTLIKAALISGPAAIEILRGESKNLAGAIAMPIFIGSGTLSACVVIDKRHEPLIACIAVLITLLVSISM